MLIKWFGSNYRTRNFARRRPLYWSQLSNNRKGFGCLIQSPLWPWNLLRRMFVKTKYGNCRKLQPKQTKHLQCWDWLKNINRFIKNCPTCLSWCCIFIRRYVRRRCLIELKCSKRHLNFKKTMGINFLLWKSLIKLMR